MDLGIGAFQDRGFYILFCELTFYMNFYRKVSFTSILSRVHEAEKGDQVQVTEGQVVEVLTASVFPWTCIDQNEHRL